MAQTGWIKIEKIDWRWVPHVVIGWETALIAPVDSEESVIVARAIAQHNKPWRLVLE